MLNNNQIRIFLFWLILSSKISSSQETSIIALMPLEPIGVSDFEAKSFTEKLRVEINKYRKNGNFVTIEQQQIDKLFNEQGLQQTGCTSTECIVKAGEMLGANIVISGQVIEKRSCCKIEATITQVDKNKVLRKINDTCRNSIEDAFNGGIINLGENIVDEMSQQGLIKLYNPNIRPIGRWILFAGFLTIGTALTLDPDTDEAATVIRLFGIGFDVAAIFIGARAIKDTLKHRKWDKKHALK